MCPGLLRPLSMQTALAGRALGNARRPRSEFRRRCDTYTNFVQPGLFNHSRLRACSQPAEMPSPGTGATATVPWRRPAMQAAKREPGVTAAMRSASLTVSTSVSSGSIRIRSPACSSRASCLSPVSGCDIGTPRMRAGSTSRRPSSQKPPSSAMPKVASAVLDTSGSAAAASRPGVTCGVSIPISTTGSGSVTRASASAQAMRSSRPAPRCPITSNPAGSQRPGAPSRASTRRATVVAATAASVSVRAASARAAASSGVNGGVSRVFTRPGTGSFAITITCAASRRSARLQAGGSGCAAPAAPRRPRAPSRRCLPV